MDLYNPRNTIWRFCLLEAAIVYVWLLCSDTDCYNLDIKHYVPFKGPDGSLFGYSVLLHKYGRETWLLVGAPVANSSYDQFSKTPGAIYKCKIAAETKCQQINLGSETNASCGKTCLAETDNQWLGVSLSGPPGSGQVLACGHRWKNVYYSRKEKKDKLPHGICYKLEPDLIQSSPLIPCYIAHQHRFGQDYGSCQAGISSFMTEGLVVMGAPGLSYWTGSVLVYNTSSKMQSVYVDDGNVVLVGSYLGYSVGAGHFSHPDATEVVGGAPQYEQTGKVFIFKVVYNKLHIIFETAGSKTGSYFGASVCAVDLNSDGLSDLLVGAPMSSKVREEGRVYVYINQGDADMKVVEFALAGSDSYAARFGETITSLGDIDNDGFPDVAIGAPQEDELHGAIYIYNGRKTGIAKAFSQRISGTVMGKSFMMFGQSVSGGVDVDDDGYPDVAVGASLSDWAVVLRTRPVVIVDAAMFLPLAVNRSLPLCTENGQASVCLNISVCFRIRGRRFPGVIELLYNLTADVGHKKDFLARFYFSGNGTSNTTEGKVSAQYGPLTCVRQQAFMRRDVRDIYTPIRFELTYKLGKHKVRSVGSRSHLPSLSPILQQSEEQTNVVTNKTEFARYCAWPNCSTNLQVSTVLVLPQSHRNASYFALGNGKTIMLNVTLVNAGDDAFLPMLHLRFPSNLYFINVLDKEEKHVSCEIAEDGETALGLDCSVGNLYITSLTKLNISFLLDVNQSSDAGDLLITVNATCDNVENEELLYDNSASVTLPLRYGVDLKVHGSVSPTEFVIGDPKATGCYTDRFNYTFKVLNVGPSKSPGTKVVIDVPKALAPYPYRLLRIVDVQTSLGLCVIMDSDNGTANSCDAPQAYLFQELVFFFSRTSKRNMYCMKEDRLCSYVVCELGVLDVGKEATIQVEVELSPNVLQIPEGRHRVMLIESTAAVMPKDNPYILSLHETAFTKVVLAAHYSQKPGRDVSIFIICVSLLSGLLILALLTYGLWKAGFFKRNFKEKTEEFRRDSWDYVPKNKQIS